MLRDAPADVYLTGEMSHHDVLHAVESGKCVILCEHTNTERVFLPVLQAYLSKWFGGEVEVDIADTDHDPLLIV